MYESFRRLSCVSPRMDRKTPFGIVHTLLSLMICLCLACATRHEAGAPCPAIEMSAVADTQTDSSKTVTLNDTTTILISRTPLVTTGDITGATASQTEDQWVLSFTVTDDAARRLRAFALCLAMSSAVIGLPALWACDRARPVKALAILYGFMKSIRQCPDLMGAC